VTAADTSKGIGRGGTGIAAKTNGDWFGPIPCKHIGRGSVSSLPGEDSVGDLNRVGAGDGGVRVNNNERDSRGWPVTVGLLNGVGCVTSHFRGHIKSVFEKIIAASLNGGRAVSGVSPNQAFVGVSDFGSGNGRSIDGKREP